MNLDDIRDAISSLKKRPIRTIVLLLMILLCIIIVTWVGGFWGEKGRQVAAKKGNIPIKSDRTSNSAKSTGQLLKVENTLISDENLLLPSEKMIHYEHIFPILDRNIFFGRYYGNLILGGVNLHLLKFAVRNSNGEVVPVKWNNDKLRFEIPWGNLYFELEYRSHYYSINVKIDNLYFYPEFTVANIERPTMDLKKSDHYRSLK